MVSYTKDLSESIKLSAENMVYKSTSKGGTIKDLLVAAKDKDSITKKSDIIYRFKCDMVECNEEYRRILKNILREIQRTSETSFLNMWPF